MARSIVLLGPPGAGKGTQAVDLAQWRGLQHVSTGDLLRKAIAARTPLGLKVKPIMDAGGLVDDDTVAALVGERLDGAEGGALLLDGYPRTLGQARCLGDLLRDRGLPDPLVIELRVPDDEVVRRLQARRSCPQCGPRSPGESSCGRCGGELVARADDAEPVIRQRLRVYHEDTSPLSEHYEGLGLLRRVDGSGSPADVRVRIRQVVESG